MFAHTVLEKKVVCVSIGLAHDAEVEIYGGHDSASRKHHLHIGTIEHAF